MSATVTTTQFSSSPSSSFRPDFRFGSGGAAAVPASSSGSSAASQQQPQHAAATPPASSSSSNIHTIHDRPALPPSPPAPASVSVSCLSAHLGASALSGAASLPVWTAVNGAVFDLSAFLSSHPGGDVILLAAGRESAPLIESYHSLDSMKRVYAALHNRCRYVGSLQGAAEQLQQQAASAAFFLAVQHRVDAFLKQRGLTHHSYEGVAVCESLLTLLLFLLMSWLCCVHGSLLAALLLGVLTARMGFLMHTGNHCAASASPRVNAFISYFMNVIGSSHLIWRHEHQVAHHLDPNELEKDNDCSIGNPFIRMHPHLPWHPWQRFQHITVPIAISFGFVKWYITDFVHFLAGRVGSVSFAVSWRQWLLLLALKLCWLCLRVLCPLLLFPLPWALLLILLPLGIGAHYLENIFIVNHIQHGLVPPAAAHWAVKQVAATSNWQSGSRLWNVVSGGLNHQIEHHLFPSMSIHLYPLIQPVVAACCADFDLPYHNYPSFLAAYKDMSRFLHAMGSESFDPAAFTSSLQLQYRQNKQRQQQQLQQAMMRQSRPAAGGVKVGSRKAE